VKIENLIVSRKQTARQRNMLAYMFGGSFVLNVLLGISVFHLKDKERIVVTPPIIEREFWVSAGTFSDSYLEQMSEYLIGLILNVTPSNFGARAEHLLACVEPANYGMLKEKLVKEQWEIERRGLSTVFHITAFRTNASELDVEVKGILKSWIGSAPADSKEQTYKISYSYNSGRLKIIDFRELKNEQGN
jgi:conjugal transfer pilus assembly protein TraE